jgi:hypothetical protein
LKFFGENPIFYGSILNLLWIIEEKGIKRKFRKSKITWTIRSPSLIEVADLMVQNARSTCTWVNRMAQMVIQSNARD